MYNLSFEKVPHFMFASNRQFEKGECHITRIYDMSVLIIMRKGVLRFSENGVPVELSEGEYYIQRPNIYQDGEVPSDSPNYFFVHFKGHYSKAGALPTRGRFDSKSIYPILNEFDELGVAAEKIEYEQLFYKLLIALKRGRKTQTTAENIRTYMLVNYQKKICLDDLAKVALLSKNQTINVFKNTYGVTPHKYLISFRLEKARELIIATNLTFNEICYAVGFSDYSNFFKLFTEEFNESPNAFRKKLSPSSLPEELYRFPEKASGITFTKSET